MARIRARLEGVVSGTDRAEGMEATAVKQESGPLSFHLISSVFFLSLCVSVLAVCKPVHTATYCIGLRTTAGVDTE